MRHLAVSADDDGHFDFRFNYLIAQIVLNTMALVRLLFASRRPCMLASARLDSVVIFDRESLQNAEMIIYFRHRTSFHYVIEMRQLHACREQACSAVSQLECEDIRRLNS